MNEISPNVIPLGALDLCISALLIIVLAALSFHMRLGIGRQLVIAAVRTAIQLVLIGWVLKTLFEVNEFVWILLMAIIMLLVAGREVVARQHRKFKGLWSYGISVLSMFISSFVLVVFALLLVIQNDPWYSPQYAIPLLGMLLGNTMNGIAIGLDRLSQTAWQQRSLIEARLVLGQAWSIAIGDIRRDSIRSGMMPMVNAMAAAGIVSLPGMMTGQILAGVQPLEAVKYQILIMFLVTAGTGFGTIGAIAIASRRLFDGRQRLRIDRLY